MKEALKSKTKTDNVASRSKGKELSLEELLEGITPEMMAPTEQEREWLDDRPTGKECF